MKAEDHDENSCFPNTKRSLDPEINGQRDPSLLAEDKEFKKRDKDWDLQLLQLDDSPRMEVWTMTREEERV